MGYQEREPLTEGIYLRFSEDDVGQISRIIELLPVSCVKKRATLLRAAVRYGLAVFEKNPDLYVSVFNEHLLATETEKETYLRLKRKFDRPKKGAAKKRRSRT